jgi:hypothetical protein
MFWQFKLNYQNILYIYEQRMYHLGQAPITHFHALALYCTEAWLNQAPKQCLW